MSEFPLLAWSPYILRCRWSESTSQCRSTERASGLLTSGLAGKWIDNTRRAA